MTYNITLNKGRLQAVNESEAIDFYNSDPDDYFIISALIGKELKEGETYQVPNNFDIEIYKKCQHKGIHNSTCIYTQYARLVPIKEQKEESSIILVRQEEPFGCVIAVIAMILGKTYQDIKSMLPPERGHGSKQGMDSFDMISFLWLHGFIGMEFYKCESYTQRMRDLDEWLIPVGEFNKVSVINEFGPHAILWMPDGRVFDPNKSGIHSINDYKEFHSLTAFWKKNL